LLDVATIESGELKLRLEAQNLSEIIVKSVAMMNIEAAKKNTAVIFNPHGVAPVLMLDAAKMRQVIDNLVSNAVKYSPPGSTITATIRSDPAQRTCSFAVQDQGPGIPDSERDKLFKDFSRLSNQPTAGEKSTGLGLAICRKIVEAHYGSITAENLPARGCEFRVTLSLPT
jgi:signal transduction histidine kinase